MTRREVIKTLALTTGSLAVSPSLMKGITAEDNGGRSYPFKVPELGYAYDALEPYIDAQTMQIHHDKHNAAYVENLNKAIAEAPDLVKKMTIEELLANPSNIPDKIRPQVRNNAGGQYNHSFFWKLLKKNPGGKPTGQLAKAIDASFGSFTAFQDKFTDASTKLFGSGWAWLVFDGDRLKIVTTANQESVVSDPTQKDVPVVGIDLWEHAYYLKYQNRRAEYVKAFWNVIDWSFASQRLTTVQAA